MTPAQKNFQAQRARELRRRQRRKYVLHDPRSGFSYFLISRGEGEALREFSPGYKLMTIGTFIKNMEG